MERWRGNSEGAIRAGMRVREQQVIIRLPDPKEMQVKAKISEAKIDRVKPGMKVDIRLDALQGLDLHGVVKKVNPYPRPTTGSCPTSRNMRRSSNPDAPDPLRQGMSSHVAIRVETIPEPRCKCRCRPWSSAAENFAACPRLRLETGAPSARRLKQ